MHFYPSDMLQVGQSNPPVYTKDVVRTVVNRRGRYRVGELRGGVGLIPLTWSYDCCSITQCCRAARVVH